MAQNHCCIRMIRRNIVPESGAHKLFRKWLSILVERLNQVHGRHAMVAGNSPGAFRHALDHERAE